MPEAPTPFGVRAVGVFFIFGACMSGISLASLSNPGSALEVIWRMNPPAHEVFAEMGPAALALMSAVCIGCALAAAGLLKRQPWGRVLAISILLVNMIGDAAAAAIRGDPLTLIGLPIAGLLIAYLMRRRVRRWFAGGPMPNKSLERTREG